jgi:eukaryotic-like serine/threonine-protein kinase
MTDDLLELVARALAERFKVERLLGRGGMGAVYLASDITHARLVAIKVLDHSLGASIGAERFAREVDLTARLQHPHICALYDSGEIRAPDGSVHLWFAMPYLAGGCLADRIRRDGPLRIADAVLIAREAATGLAFAHRQGVLHRDVKPGNILLSEDGHVQVADFGIARAMTTDGDVEAVRLTQTGLSLGTPAYMSPEQAMGERSVDARTDVYALGAVLYEMLCGSPPFSGPTAQAIIARQLTEPPRSLRGLRSDVSPALEAAVCSALEKNPSDRTPDMHAFAESLERAAMGASDPGARIVPSGPVPSRWLARIGVWSAAVLAAGLAWYAAVVIARRASTTPRAAAGPPSIAVLPFENQGAAADEYFADGMTDAIRGSLAELPALRVIGRNTSQTYKATKRSQTQIARELGARYLVTGTVRWAHVDGGPNKVEVRPELVEVISDSAPIVRWDHPVAAPLTDVFKVQGEIASQVAAALNLVLTRGVEARLAKPLTHSMDAYLAYLRGEAATARSFDPSAQKEAAADYRRAIALDSGFVQAWARLARSYAIAYFTGSQDTAVGDSSRWAGERAVALGPDNAAAADARARYYGLVKLDPDSALAEISRARALAPSDGDIAMFSGFAEWFLGNTDGALRDLEAAHQLDPRSSRTTYNLCNLYLWLHRYDQASALVATGRTVFPDAPEFRQLEIQLLLEQGNLDGIRTLFARDTLSDHDLAFVASSITGWMFAPVLDDASRRRVLRLGPDAFPDPAMQRMAQVMVYAVQHDTTRMRRAAQDVVTDLEPITKLRAPDPQRLATLGQALAYAGQKAEAIAVAARVLATPALARNVFSRRLSEQSVALIYAEAGERDKAVDLLASLLGRNDYPLTPAWLRIDPVLTSLRGHPRFEQLIAQQPRPDHPR